MKYMLIGLFAVTQSYYWFVYFPRAWRDRSNREIDNIRVFFEYLKDGK